MTAPTFTVREHSQNHVKTTARTMAWAAACIIEVARVKTGATAKTWRERSSMTRSIRYLYQNLSHSFFRRWDLLVIPVFQQ